MYALGRPATMSFSVNNQNPVGRASLVALKPKEYGAEPDNDVEYDKDY